MQFFDGLISVAEFASWATGTIVRKLIAPKSQSSPAKTKVPGGSTLAVRGSIQYGAMKLFEGEPTKWGGGHTQVCM